MQRQYDFILDSWVEHVYYGFSEEIKFCLGLKNELWQDMNI